MGRWWPSPVSTRAVRPTTSSSSESSTSGDIWWGNVNKPITEEAFDRLHARMTEYLRGREVFVQDLYAGADPEYRLPVRIVTHNAWHNLFAQNMFIRPAARDRVDFQPQFTVLQVPEFKAEPERDGTRSEVFVLQFREAPDRRHLLCRRDQEEHLQRHELPAAGQGRAADALLRQYRAARRHRRVLRPVRHRQTTLSADGSRTLIGDDEHGWSNTSVFNFEGGCYAKVIKLSEKSEPEIYSTTRVSAPSSKTS